MKNFIKLFSILVLFFFTVTQSHSAEKVDYLKTDWSFKGIFGNSRKPENKPIWFIEFKTKPKTKEFSFLKPKLNQKQMGLYFLNPN